MKNWQKIAIGFTAALSSTVFGLAVGSIAGNQNVGMSIGGGLGVAIAYQMKSASDRSLW